MLIEMNQIMRKLVFLLSQDEELYSKKKNKYPIASRFAKFCMQLWKKSQASTAIYKYFEAKNANFHTSEEFLS